MQRTLRALYSIWEVIPIPDLADKLSLSYMLGRDYNPIQADLILSTAYEVAAVTGMG